MASQFPSTASRSRTGSPATCTNAPSRTAASATIPQNTLSYREKKEPDLPLEDNPEFRSIKNKIIKAVLELPLPENYGFDSEADLHATEEELKYAAQAEKQGEHFYPPNVGSVPPVTQVTQMTENHGAAYAALY